MTSKNKIRANKKNAKKSTGPKTQEGKEVASQNSLKHGIWAKQLTISPDETADYERLVNDLEALLKPKGPILQYYFDEIVLCMWRLKKLVVFGNPQFRAWDGGALLTEKAEGSEDNPEQSEEKVVITSRSEFEEKLQSSGKKALDKQEELLGALEVSILRGEILTTQQKEYIAEVFGKRFLDELELLLPTGYEATQTGIAEMMEGKFKHYPPKDMNLPKMKRAILCNELLLEVVRGRKKDVTSQRAGHGTAKNKVPSPDLLALSLDLQLGYSSALKRDLKKAIDAYYYNRDVRKAK